MLVIALYVPLIRYWYNGPFWPQTSIERNFCKDTWWKNILYINNFFKSTDTVRTYFSEIIFICRVLSPIKVMALEGRLRNINSEWQSRGELYSHLPYNTMTLISNNSRIKMNYFDSNIIQKRKATLLRCFPKDYFAADVDRSNC